LSAGRADARRAAARRLFSVIASKRAVGARLVHAERRCPARRGYDTAIGEKIVGATHTLNASPRARMLTREQGSLFEYAAKTASKPPIAARKMRILFEICHRFVIISR